MHSERLSALVAELQAISPMPGDEELEALSEEGSRRPAVARIQARENGVVYC